LPAPGDYDEGTLAAGEQDLSRGAGGADRGLSATADGSLPAVTPLAMLRHLMEDTR